MSCEKCNREVAVYRNEEVGVTAMCSDCLRHTPELRGVRYERVEVSQTHQAPE